MRVLTSHFVGNLQMLFSSDGPHLVDSKYYFESHLRLYLVGPDVHSNTIYTFIIINHFFRLAYLYPYHLFYPKLTIVLFSPINLNSPFLFLPSSSLEIDLQNTEIFTTENSF